jgi:hypothetical protein
MVKFKSDWIFADMAISIRKVVSLLVQPPKKATQAFREGLSVNLKACFDDQVSRDAIEGSHEHWHTLVGATAKDCSLCFVKAHGSKLIAVTIAYIYFMQEDAHLQLILGVLKTTLFVGCLAPFVCKCCLNGKPNYPKYHRKMSRHLWIN